MERLRGQGHRAKHLTTEKDLGAHTIKATSMCKKGRKTMHGLSCTKLVERQGGLVSDIKLYDGAQVWLNYSYIQWNDTQRIRSLTCM